MKSREENIAITNAPMTGHDLQQQLNDVLPDSAHSPGLPLACYADDDLLGLERRAVFLTSWAALGRADRWLNSGDYSALEPSVSRFPYWYAQQLLQQLNRSPEHL